MDKIKISGAAAFRWKLVLATLSGNTVRMEDIRAFEESPGITNYEASFLKLLELVTNGSKFYVDEVGTTVKYTPGSILGGSGLEFDCDVERSIGYYLEPLIVLAPFAKKPIEIVLRGVVNDEFDISPDVLRVVTLPFLKNFGIEEGLELKITKRGAPPLGGGEVHFKCCVVKQLKSVNLVKPGKIKRVRGVAYTTKVNPMIATRVVSSARELLNNFIPDVWIFTDHSKGPSSGLSPGYGLSLIAESNTGFFLSSEMIGSENTTPEELGAQVSQQLCDEIAMNGCVDSAHQHILVILMALCPEDVSCAKVGKLTQNAIQVLRLLKTFFGITFQIKAERDESSVLLSCRGVGFENLSRKPLA